MTTKYYVQRRKGEVYDITVETPLKKNLREEDNYSEINELEKKALMKEVMIIAFAKSIGEIN